MRISGHSPGGCQFTAQATPVTAAAATSQSTTTQLSLTTAEGDKVVLSLSASSLDGAASAGSDYASIRTRQSQVSIQVEGNLSTDELRDIRKLAGIVARAANGVLRGDFDRAAHQAAQATKLDSIQNFAFSLNRQVAAVYNYQTGGARA